MNRAELYERCRTGYWLARDLAVALGDEITRRGGDMSRVSGSGFTTGHGFALESGWQYFDGEGARVVYGARAYELGQRSIQRDQRSAEQWVDFASGQLRTAFELSGIPEGSGHGRGLVASDSNLRSAFWRAVDAAGRFDVYLRGPFEEVLS